MTADPPAREPDSEGYSLWTLLEHTGGMIIAPGQVRRRLLEGSPGGVTDLLLVLALQLAAVQTARLVHSVWSMAAVGLSQGSPGLLQVVSDTAAAPLVLTLVGSLALRLATPEGLHSQHTLDLAAVCAIPMSLLSGFVSLAAQLTGAAVPGWVAGVGYGWFALLVVHFALAARRQSCTPVKPERLRLVVGGVVLALVAGGLATNLALIAVQPERVRPVTRGSQAPLFSLPDLEGRQHQLAALQGRVVLLEFWASWCAPCLRKMPALERLQAEQGPRGLRVLAVNVEGSAAPVRRYLEGRKVQRGGSPSGLTYLLDRGQAASRYGVRVLPHMVLVDRRGKVALVKVGAGDDAALAQAVEQALKGE